MRSPLAVRINDGTNDRHVTARTRGLRFTKAANGGFMFAEMRVIVPHDTFTDLGPADQVVVYDSRTGRTVWQGFVENPGLTDGPAGQEYAIRAQGTVTLASDESRPLVYIDRDLGVWLRDENGGVAASATTQASADPTGVLGDGLLCQFNPGQPIDTGYVAQIAYHALAAAGMEFGAINVTTKSGKIDTGYRTELAWTPPSSYGTIGSSTGITTTALDNNRFVGAGAEHPPEGVTRIALRLRRTGGATNVADDNTWAIFASVAVLGRRMDRYGTLVVGLTGGMITNEYVRADWVVEDLLGRVLANVCDPAASTIEATTFDIDQLAYHDGARVSQILDDLARFEPDMLWEILHSTDRGYVFNYRAWPTTPRYEISVKDGYEATGSASDLCNRIAVYWTDPQGRKQVTTVTADVPALGGDPADAGFTGRVRDADPVTLPEGRGSAANAQRLGELVLEQQTNPPRAARATVARPVMDRLRGAMVMPHEIETGYLVRVREMGEDVRLTEMSYDDDSGSAELTLGTPARSFEELLAGLDD